MCAHLTPYANPADCSSYEAKQQACLSYSHCRVQVPLMSRGRAICEVSECCGKVASFVLYVTMYMIRDYVLFVFYFEVT